MGARHYSFVRQFSRNFEGVVALDLDSLKVRLRVLFDQLHTVDFSHSAS